MENEMTTLQVHKPYIAVTREAQSKVSLLEGKGRLVPQVEIVENALDKYNEFLNKKLKEKLEA